MRGARLPSIAGVAMLILATWLLTGCSGDSDNPGNSSRQETTATETTVAEADGSGSGSEVRTTTRTTTPADSPNPMRLTNFGGTASFPIFSPNGKKIAFWYLRERRQVRHGFLVLPGETGGGVPGLYMMNSDGTDVTRIAKGSVAGQAAFSPDGTKIAFVSNLTTNREIYIASTDGTNRKNLTNNPASDENPTWSPDGKKIAFVRYLGGGGKTQELDVEIYIINSDGTDQTNLTNTLSGIHDEMPSFSPNEEKIAFMSNRDVNRYVPVGIYVMNADGTNPTRVSGQAMGIFPRFSPDGTKIVFTSGIGVYVVNSDGSNLTEIANDGLPGGVGPIFFPDGEKIAFPSSAEGDEEVYAINTDRTNRINLTNNHAAHDNEPTFSPDGKKMAFSSTRPSADPKAYVSEIYLMDLTKRLRQ